MSNRSEDSFRRLIDNETVALLKIAAQNGTFNNEHLTASIRRILDRLRSEASLAMVSNEDIERLTQDTLLAFQKSYTEEVGQLVRYSLARALNEALLNRTAPLDDYHEENIAQSLYVLIAMILSNQLPGDQLDKFATLVFSEADLLLKKAEEMTPDNTDTSYVLRVFHRLAEGFLSSFSIEKWPTDDIGAIAHTAEDHFRRNWKHAPKKWDHPHWAALLLIDCLQRAFEEEGRKIVFPVFDYSTIPEPEEGELVDYETGYDSLMLST